VLALRRSGGRDERVVTVDAQDGVLAALNAKCSNGLANQASQDDSSVDHAARFSQDLNHHHRALAGHRKFEIVSAGSIDRARGPE
jgi:hypothetical protein